MEINYINSSKPTTKRKRDEVDETEHEQRKKIRLLIETQLSILQNIKASEESNDFPYLISQFSELNKGSSEAIQTLTALENRKRPNFFLPHEILIRIFSFLDYASFFQVQRVCKLFAAASADKECSVVRNLAFAAKICQEHDLSETFLKLVEESIRIGYLEIIRRGQDVSELFLESSLFEDFIQKKVNAHEEDVLLEIENVLFRGGELVLLRDLYRKVMHLQAREGKIEQALETRIKIGNLGVEGTSIFDWRIDKDELQLFEWEIKHREGPLSKSCVLAYIFEGKEEEIQDKDECPILEKIAFPDLESCYLPVMCNVCCLQAKRHINCGNVQAAQTLFTFAKTKLQAIFTAFDSLKSAALSHLCAIAIYENEVGRKTEAVQTLKDAYQMAENNVDLLMRVVYSQIKINNRENAKVTFEQARKQVESRCKIHFLLKYWSAYDMLLGAKMNFSRKSFERLVESNLKNPWAFVGPDYSGVDYIGFALERGWIEEAHKLIEQIKDPENLNDYVKLFEYYFDQNQIENAEKIVNLCASSASDPLYAYMTARVAHVYEKKGDTQSARNLINKITVPVLRFMAFLSLISPEGARLLFFNTWHFSERSKFKDVLEPL